MLDLAHICELYMLWRWENYGKWWRCYLRIRRKNSMNKPPRELSLSSSFVWNMSDSVRTQKPGFRLNSPPHARPEATSNLRLEKIRTLTSANADHQIRSDQICKFFDFVSELASAPKDRLGTMHWEYESTSRSLLMRTCALVRKKNWG